MGKNLDVDLKPLDAVFQLPGEGPPVVAEIRVEGLAQRYWQAVEFGSASGMRPWPRVGRRTVMSGGRVHSVQAPGGFAAPHRLQILQWLKDKFTQKLTELNRPPTREEMAVLANSVAEDAANLFRGSAPVETGALRDAIQVKRT